MTGLVDLSPVHLATVEDILAEHVPDCEVRVFGSRAKWSARDASDLDLAIVGDGPLPSRTLTMLKEAFEESRLPMRVDVIDWNAIADSFRESIDLDTVVVQGATLSGHWPMVRLGDCITTNEETVSPKGVWPYINYLDTGNITENRVDEIQHLIVGRDKIPTRARRKVRKGDIVYSMVRPNQRHYGLLKDIPENLLVSTGFVVIRGKEGVAHTDFVYWFLTQDHIVEHLQAIAEHSTSAYPSIRPSDIEAIEFPLPPLEKQRRIARILCTLEAKIKLNRRMSETLEEMARALFKSWFVDFDPVHAKLEGRWQRGQSLPGLPAKLWDLFPDRMVDSELGEIPKGWKIGVLDDAVELFSGGTPRTSEPLFWHGDIPWYTAKDAPSLSDIFVLSTERSITQEGVDSSSTTILPSGTTVITARGTVGRLACLGVPMAMNQTCYGIRGVAGYPDFFTYWKVRMSVDELQTRTHGTIFDTITRQTFTLIKTALAPQEVAQVFESEVELLMRIILANLQGSQVLATQRDALLPWLVSGRREAEKRYEEGKTYAVT